MRVNEAGCVGERHMVATSCSASAMMSEAIWETMCTPSTRGVSGLAASQPETMVNEPAVPLISMRAFASIG